MWRFLGFYGQPETHLRFESWSCLHNLHSQNSLPWLYARDFNEITKSQEKFGGRLRPQQQLQFFHDALDECGLRDLGYVGNKFTWCKNYPNGLTIWERLYRAMCSNNCLAMFPASKAVTLQCVTSSHKPIIVHPLGISIKKKRPWRLNRFGWRMKAAMN